MRPATQSAVGRFSDDTAASCCCSAKPLPPSEFDPDARPGMNPSRIELSPNSAHVYSIRYEANEESHSNGLIGFHSTPNGTPCHCCRESDRPAVMLLS